MTAEGVHPLYPCCSLLRNGLRHLPDAVGCKVQFENAINAFSLALKLARDPSEEARVLSNRSGAFARCSQCLTPSVSTISTYC